MKKVLIISLSAIFLGYLLLWPVEIEPVSWDSLANKGYVDSFAQNQHLSQIQRIDLSGKIGPEDYALSPNGHIYYGLLGGEIGFLDKEGKLHSWVNTQGRPLGLEFDKKGNLIVADAFEGLLEISPEGVISKLVTEIDGIPLNYADDVDVADNGKMYFTDASTKFHAKQYGTFEASMLDIMEHGGHGRVLEYDPATKQAITLLSGLNFANGITISHDQNWVLVNETGTYRIIKIGITDSNKGQVETVIENLPGFPDNISRGSNGVYWVGLVSPRSAALDALSGYGFLRKVVQRLPKFLQPKAKHFGHIIAINDQGKVVHNLQDPLGMYGHTTGAIEVGGNLYVSSLHENALGKAVNVNLNRIE
ncbi:MAG: sugar lactone lactonase YvrE [Bermanella sp.]|jgi:sugar lactone lactonase YvrE